VPSPSVIPSCQSQSAKPASDSAPIITTDRAKCEYERFSLRLEDTLRDAAFRVLGRRWWDRLYILLSSPRNYLGRLHTLLLKDRVSVSLGPSLEYRHPSWTTNKRTLARKQGIKNLLATHPWADFLDLETFLMGFDAGEQWAASTADSSNTLRPYRNQASR
jgi:hypothetical protein